MQKGKKRLENFLLEFADCFEIGMPQNNDIGEWWRVAVQELNSEDWKFIRGVLEDHKSLVEGNEMLRKMRDIMDDQNIAVK